MLNLAQIKKNLISGEMELELLASQTSNKAWVLGTSEYMHLDEGALFPEGVLVLVEHDREGKITSIKDAKDWILSVIEEYLTHSAITPNFVAKEQEKIEKWRQEIASESQDLTRRYLELETRREQLQELEENLKREKEKLEIKSKTEGNC